MFTQTFVSYQRLSSAMRDDVSPGEATVMAVRTALGVPRKMRLVAMVPVSAYVMMVRPFCVLSKTLCIASYHRPIFFRGMYACLHVFIKLEL